MQQPRKKRSSVGFESGDEYNEEINDKLNDLWSQMKHRKNEIIKSITPGYSRKTDNHNSFSVEMVDKSRQVDRSREPDRLVSAEGEIIKLRDKLVAEVAANKQKDVEIAALKKHIAELTNDKKQLLLELHNFSNLSYAKQDQPLSVTANQENSNQQNIKHELNESSIRKTNKKVLAKAEAEDQTGIESDNQRLLTLLRSTEEYREFVFYYDNNELSFLRALNKQRRRNCQCDLSERQKTMWAPKDVIDLMVELNKRHRFGLSRDDVEKIVYNINLVYLQRQKAKQSRILTQCEKRIREAEREANHAIPYQIMQIQKQKERELVGRKSKRVHSLASNK